MTTAHLLALDEALKRLDNSTEKARLVKLRFFAGCTLEETAEILGVSRATVQRTWAYAGLLFGQLTRPEADRVGRNSAKIHEHARPRISHGKRTALGDSR